MQNVYWIACVLLSLFCSSARSQDIGPGNLDDFEDDTVQGWIQPANAFGTINIPGGGDGGADDNYLEVSATGLGGPGGKLVALNRDARWTGDWIGAGVNKVRVNVANLGDDDLPLRIAFRRAGATPYCWVLSTPVNLPADALWRNFELLIDESTMEQVGTAVPFVAALSEVTEVRMLSAAAPSCQGDQIEAFVGFDDIQTDADTDLDGINDGVDNCTEAANPRLCIDNTGATSIPAPAFTSQFDCNIAGFDWGQPDTDNDSYGNACDFDIAPQPGPFLSGDCQQNFLDLQALKAAFFSNSTQPQYNPNADFDFDGSINFADLQALKNGLFGSPGPGLGNCGCAPEDQGLDNGADFFIDDNMDMVNDIEQLFVRGGMVLDWGAVEQINNVVNTGGGAYQARFSIDAAGNWGYKVADEGWVVQYSNFGTPPTEVGVPVTLERTNVGPNSQLIIDEPGCYQFDFTVIPDDPPDPTMPVPAMDLTVTGPLP